MGGLVLLAAVFGVLLFLGRGVPEPRITSLGGGGRVAALLGFVLALGGLVFKVVSGESTDPSDAPVVTASRPVESVAEAMSISGVGGQLVGLGSLPRPVVVQLSYEGSGYFGVSVVTSIGTPGEVLASAEVDSSYAGVQILDSPSSQITGLQVQGSGKWTIDFLRVEDVDSVGDRFTGAGNTVMMYEGVGGAATVVYVGDGPFFVRGQDGRLFASHLTEDPFESVVAWPAGPMLFEVFGDEGTWSIEIGEANGLTVPAQPPPPGTAIDPDTAAMVDNCFARWVEAQRLGRVSTFDAKQRDAVFRPFGDACEPATAAVSRFSRVSPARSPVVLLAATLQAVLDLRSGLPEEFWSCSERCQVPASLLGGFMVLSPDSVDGLPSLLAGYLGDGASAPSWASIEGLVVVPLPGEGEEPVMLPRFLGLRTTV